MGRGRRVVRRATLASMWPIGWVGPITGLPFRALIASHRFVSPKPSDIESALYRKSALPHFVRRMDAENGKTRG